MPLDRSNLPENKFKNRDGARGRAFRLALAGDAVTGTSVALAVALVGGDGEPAALAARPAAAGCDCSNCLVVGVSGW